MKSKIVISIVILLTLVGCGRTTTRTTFFPLVLKAIDHNKNGDLTPVSIQFNTPMKAGDILTIRHKQRSIATLELTDDLKLDTFHIRIRALGDGRVNAALERKGKSTLYSDKNITVEKFNPIPERNKTKLKTHFRTKDGSYKMIIMNDSAVSGFVKTVNVDFGHGKAIVTGSKYLSPNPYFLFKPIKLGKKPSTKITLDK